MFKSVLKFKFSEIFTMLLSKVFLHFMFTDQKTNIAQEKHNNKFTSVAQIQSMIGQLEAGRSGVSIKHL